MKPLLDVSTDFLRREARASQAEHAAAVRAVRDALARLFGDTRAPRAAKHELALGGLDRRRFLRVGGLTIASAAVLAACGDDAASGGGNGDENGEDEAGSEGDIEVLRTASSLELLAVDVYQKAIDSGLLTTTAIADAAALFQAQHREHADLFMAATKRLGGEPFDAPNPVVQQQLAGALSAATDEPALVRLALQLEQAAAATYVSSVGSFDDAALDQATMSVGSVEARHVAVLSAALGQPAAPAARYPTTGAVAPGTGV